MNPRSPLARHQTRRLKQIAGLGLCTDVSLAAFLEENGESCDRSLLSKQRAGEAPAKFGLLDMILLHVDDPSAVLSLWARDYDCVVMRRDVGAAKCALGEILDVLAHGAELARLVQDGASVDELRKRAEQLEQETREVTAAVAAMGGAAPRRTA